ncbi:Endonuclease/exonuclease/phosphatase [Psychromonas ingrahamii 37]|uniref:Endonuclease/exonuclease/phosphatase n=1 Tax=Psychromonas ingrahamii (strain DSM 17664 / CCUG 51855 / 37) TaxID=357804 RepID=A1SV15_PSYIN|nr:endonuclease/exonuclease/phosphatase family protein [Psychromonas ingrahamii]ABM03330.1 Endonuclease/exonuclease/phosphatase [Psychromonas ingrahamii 37]
MNTEYYFAWWNVENLFEENNSANRPEWLQKKLNAELKGWGKAELQIKLQQLATVINAMNDGKGPDLLGVCEVESSRVLLDLVRTLNQPKRNYAVVHADNSDMRGIDVAFIYDRNLFEIETTLDDAGIVKNRVFHHVIQKQNATRDLVQVNFKTKQGNNFIVIGNHWPSRLGGEIDSEPYRMMAGETLSYFLDRIKKIRGEIPVLVMGDFNDQPFNRSLTSYTLSSNQISKVKSNRNKNPYLYNMMWPLMDGTQGTHSYGGEWAMLDQILVNRGALKNKKFYTSANKVKIFSFEGMIIKNEVIRHSRP